MNDKASQLKSIAELYQQGLLTAQEFEVEKAKILNSDDSSNLGPVPNYRRNGWAWWIIIFVTIILGTILSSLFYNSAHDNCSPFEAYVGICEPDSGLLLLSILFDLVTLSAFVVQFYWNYKMFWELNKHMQGRLTEPLLSCIPILNIFVFYGYCTELNNQARLRGVRNFLNPEVTCCTLFVLGLGLPLFQDKLNEFWDIVKKQYTQNSSHPPPQVQVAPPLQQTVEWQ